MNSLLDLIFIFDDKKRHYKVFPYLHLIVMNTSSFINHFKYLIHRLAQDPKFLQMKNVS